MQASEASVRLEQSVEDWRRRAMQEKRAKRHFCRRGFDAQQRQTEREREREAASSTVLKGE